MPSMATFSELVLSCLDAAGARSVAEVGAYRGELTSTLLDWAADREGSSVVAVDPKPAPELAELARRRPELDLIETTSHAALRAIDVPDAVIVDGDHNYFTVSGELEIIDERVAGRALPLLLFHDVAWPHARRDSYYEPERIPDQHRRPLARDLVVAPGEPGAAESGLTLGWAAEREGGPRNGVLTAIEDFVSSRDGLRLAVIPIFSGFGAVWSDSAPWAGEISRLLDPWDRNPILDRLEAERLDYLIKRRRTHEQLVAIRDGRDELRRELEALRERAAEQEQLLREILGSRAFGAVSRLSSLGGGSAVSRQRVQRALGEPES